MSWRRRTGTVRVGPWRGQPAVLEWRIGASGGVTRDQVVARVAGRVVARRIWTGDRRAAEATWRRSSTDLVPD